MKEKVEILILGAVEREIKSIQRNVQDAKTYRGKPVSVITGRIGWKKVMVGTTGVGITNAAMSTTSILENYDVGSIFLIGIGGVYENSDLEPGDVAVATSEIYGDMGIETKNDWSTLDEIGIPLWNTGKKSFYHVWPVDDKLRSQVSRVLKLPKKRTFSISFGPFVTVSCVSGDKKRAAILEKRFKGICENMEGAAVAHVSLAYGVPFLECRGISNIAGIRDKTKWRVEEAIQNCTEIILQLVQNQ